MAVKLTGFLARHRALLALVLGCFALRCIPLGGAPGEYTDGILQLTVFENNAGLYPPLYGALAHALHLVTAGLLSLETAGRLISNASAAACIALVFALGNCLGGRRAAWPAAVLFTVAPLPWRWAERVMTDSLFMLLNTAALYALMRAWVFVRTDNDSADERKSSRLLGCAVAAGALATLTRYQGVLLTPLLAAVFILHVKRFRRAPLHALAAGTIWLLVPLWMIRNGFAHQDQFASRTGLTAWSTIGAWWNTLESFVLVSPYYFGYPIALAALAGAALCRRSAVSFHARPAAILWGGFTVMLLVLQAAFGSFQYRYMLPLLPFVAALAGCGFRGLEDNFSRAPWVSRWAFMLSVIYLAFFTLSVVFLQSGRAFQDQRQAAQFVRNNVAATTPVYSNERYGAFTKLGSVKATFWSGREVKLLPLPDAPLEDGSILLLGTAYGGNEAVLATMQAVNSRYTLTPLTPEPFRSRLLPLLDDIMVNPMFNQNPMGWVVRYVPQEFATQVFRVNLKKGVGTAP